MKNIIIVVNNSWYAWKMRSNLALFLKKNGYNITFVAPHDDSSEKIKQNFNYINIKINSKSINPFNEIRTLIQFYKIYKKNSPNIVLHYNIKPNIYGTLIAAYLNIPIVNNIAGLGTIFSRNTLFTKFIKLLYRFSQNRASKVFFQNRDDYEIFIKNKIIKINKCDIVPGSGVDTNYFKPMKTTKGNKFRFLLVSRMLWLKGIGEYVNAAREIKQKYNNIEFILIGHLEFDSPTSIGKQQMKKWENENIINYLGVIDNIKNEIAKADCIILPSYYREGVPKILLEAASMEKPIITTHNVGCKDVVDDCINGYLCKTKDVKDLINKIEMMINLSDKERENMGRAGRKKMIKEFEERIVLDKYIKAIREFI